MATPSPIADRNLIFGLLALQMDFVTGEQLLDALHAWMLDKHTPLGQILRSLKLHLVLLDPAPTQTSVRQHLTGIDDNEVQASLAGLNRTRIETGDGSAGRTHRGAAISRDALPGAARTCQGGTGRGVRRIAGGPGATAPVGSTISQGEV